MGRSIYYDVVSYQHAGVRCLRVILIGVAASLVAAACTATTESVGDRIASSDDQVTSSQRTSSSEVVETLAPSTSPALTTTAPSTAPATTTSTTTTTTTSAPPLDVFAPECVVRVEAAAALETIAAAHGVADIVALWFENGQPDVVPAGGLIDICTGNELNDIDGQPRPPIEPGALERSMAANVQRQQTKLNELFAGYGTEELEVDGVSGPRTGQRLCAARLALGLNPTIEDMMPGTDEQATLLSAGSLPTPVSTATESERWVLIDRTCQMMFVGTGEQTVFVFPTSTGSEGYATRDQDRAEAFRFNPALENGGWHDSSEYPVGVDNPLNGNLYKPLYFDLGQAIHGANNVPPTPASKGCARISVADQDTLIAWLGLDAATGETWRKSEINVTVNVQGGFVPRST